MQSAIITQQRLKNQELGAKSEMKWGQSSRALKLWGGALGFYSQ